MFCLGEKWTGAGAIALLGFLLTAFPALAFCGLGREAVELTSSASEVKPSQSPSKKVENSVRLRCWQNGQIIFESKNLKPSNKSVPTIYLADKSTSSRVQVYDLKQAICITDSEM